MSMKNYVLDTNVLLHDPQSILAFEEHNVIISSVVLEELDGLKKSNQSIAADARQVIRILGSLIDDADIDDMLNKGVVRNQKGGLLFVINAGRSRSDSISNDEAIIEDGLRVKASNQKPLSGCETVFVSRDINARLISKSRKLGGLKVTVILPV